MAHIHRQAQVGAGMGASMKNRLDDVPVDVAAWRLKHGLTVGGAAKLIGVSRWTLSKYENGAPVPRVVRLAMIGAIQEVAE